MDTKFNDMTTKKIVDTGKSFMRAMLIRAYGPPEVFEWGEMQTPSIKDDELLIKVQGSSVNPVDAAIRQGLLKNFVRLKLPAVLGVDVSGEVVRVGNAVTKFKTGDRVYAFTGIDRGGGYGEFAAVPQSYAAKIPHNLNVVEAGVVPGVGLTALEAFKDHADLKSEQKVLINGASGGVGTFAVQIAKNMGAEVTAVCSTGKIKLVKRLGADRVIDYKEQNLLATSERYDVILNCARSSSNLKLRRLLKPKGKLLIIAGNPLQIPLLKLLNWFSSKKSIIYFVKPLGKNLRALTMLIEEGKVTPVIEKTYSWEDIAEAHHQVESGRTAGKICINLTKYDHQRNNRPRYRSHVRHRQGNRIRIGQARHDSRHYVSR